MRKQTFLIRMSLIQFCLAVCVNLSLGQQNSSSYFLHAITSQMDSGHFSNVDTLYRQYVHCPCFKDAGKKDTARQILLLVKVEKRLDGYRVDEMDSIETLLNKLRKKSSALIFRPGMSIHEHLSSTGGLEFGGGVMVNLYKMIGYTALGIGVGGMLNSVPFGVDVTHPGSNLPNGYYLKANGHFSTYSIPIQLSVIPGMESSEDDFSLGVILGVEWTRIRNTYLDSSYYEYGYVDSSYGGNLGGYRSAYSTIGRGHYQDNTYFNQRSFLYFTPGIIANYLLTESLNMKISILYLASLSGKLNVANTNASISPNYWRIAISFDFKL